MRILVTALHAAVAVVIDRAVADVVTVHEIDNVGNSLRIVCGIAVDLHIKYMATACQFMIRSLYFGLVARGAFVVDRHMI